MIRLCLLAVLHLVVITRSYVDLVAMIMNVEPVGEHQLVSQYPLNYPTSMYVHNYDKFR